MNHNINFKNGPIMVMEGYDSEPYHMHRNAQELIWVLEGEAGITFNNTEYILTPKDDLILIVDEDFHKVRKISGKLRYISFYIDLPYFQKYIKDILNVGLYVNPGYRTPEQAPHLKKMRVLLSQIVKEYEHGENSHQLIEITNQLLLLIRNHFNFLGTTSIDYKDEHTFDRLFAVYDFVYQHYTERVTLADLAEHIHVNQAYLSRSIKQLTGMGFIDILNYVRCEEALRLLLETDKSITAIAYDCGFSDPKYFHQYFDKFFHANPAVFRKSHKTEMEDYSLMEYQKAVSFDESLQDILQQYWEEGEIYGRKLTHISFSSAEKDAARERKPLTLTVCEKDFSEGNQMLAMLSETEKSLGAVNLMLAEKTDALYGIHDGKLWSETLRKALIEKQVPLFAASGGWNGLYTACGIRTPLYYMLREAAKAEGSWEYGNNYAVCRGEMDKPFMLLLTWNGSLDRGTEFLTEFEKGSRRYLIAEYEFSKQIMESEIELEKLSLAGLPNGKGKAILTDMTRPYCTSQLMNIGEEGYTLKIGPGKAKMLWLIQL